MPQCDSRREKHQLISLLAEQVGKPIRASNQVVTEIKTNNPSQ